MKILDQGAPPIWPKVLKCRGCGGEVLVESIEDAATHLPNFMWIQLGPVRSFHFACPNACGSFASIVCPAELQAFLRAPHVLYGGDDVCHAGYGTRRVDPARRQFRRRQTPQV